jgi:hypothetical protein
MANGAWTTEKATARRPSSRQGAVARHHFLNTFSPNRMSSCPGIFALPPVVAIKVVLPLARAGRYSPCTTVTYLA